MSVSTDTWALILTILAGAIGGTWALRSKLASIETAFREHVASDVEKFKNLGARVVHLEARKKAARR